MEQVKMTNKQDVKKIIPDEMYIYFHHGGQELWHPDYESVYWYRANEYDDGDPVKEHLQYFRKHEMKNVCSMPSDEIWQTFFQKLEQIGVYSWQSKKIIKIENVTDLSPCTWKVEIVSQDGNKFEVSGPIDKLPPRFNEFCEAVSELIGQPFGKD